MKTPKEYIKNLKDGILTDQMVSDVLFSYSKRAKNYRDKARELREYYRRNRYYIFSFHDINDSIETNEFRKNVLYERKSDILEKVEDRFLKCIHKQDKHATVRIYDYDSRYEELEDSDDVVWSNCYYDRDEEREVWFIDVLKENKEYLYFKFYEFSDRSFHTPITEDEALKYESEKNLKIEEIDDLVTFGEDTGVLLSLQFCDKVYKFLYPDKVIYKISQPVCVSYSFSGGNDCRFYTDEEIKKYREEKEEKRRVAAEEREKRKIERKQKTEEARKLKKIADKEHKEFLKNFLKVNGETDWNVIYEKISDRKPKDSIFEKIFVKLPEEQKNIILNEFWESEKKKIDSTIYKTKIYPILEKCPEKLKKIMLCIIDYVVSSTAYTQCEWGKDSLLKEYAFNMKEKSYINMIESMISYNEGKIRDEGEIIFIRTDKQGLCFCNVPLFGNICDMFMYETINKHIPKMFKYMQKKDFNKMFGGNIFLIEKRLMNRCRVGYEKFKKEAEKLIKKNE